MQFFLCFFLCLTRFQLEDDRRAKKFTTHAMMRILEVVITQAIATTQAITEAQAISHYHQSSKDYQNEKPH